MINVIISYIQQVIIDNGKNENLLIRTDKIQQSVSNKNISNFDIYEVMHLLENKEIVKINSVANQGEQYTDRVHWIEKCDNFSRYNIDILRPEYFNNTSVKDPNWAISAYFDEDRCKFIIELNGVDIIKEISVAKMYKGKETNIFRILKRLQDNNGKFCYVNDICNKYLDTIREFFYRFSDNSDKKQNIFSLLIENQRGTGSLCFNQTIYSRDLIYQKVTQLTLQNKHKRPDNTDNIYREKYSCVLDENGNFKKWVRM